MAVLVDSIEKQVQTHGGSVKNIPAEQAGNTRNDMYLASKAIKVLHKDKTSDLNAADKATLTKYQGMLNASTRCGW